uniref:Uncharacterized protein n=1 Tax=Chromera velia CCMP2878 TaxID=1169474 RepID=A0A0G4HBM8_9ALVE|eukprot:Cvel_6221.t1-p1 / transcript=Cvel_6221.t1 / gene=Cvel_6221 / organism=Chromera_velia_CCMP2878 / gene_product=hypothetical protein / transcript_product=hypothetical protein / location=Cvel_scaffold301:13018-23186(-) / protein_length=1473 / sequence_SO=supercontig / SO=protein_coding / is_pseudo=false
MRLPPLSIPLVALLYVCSLGPCGSFLLSRWTSRSLLGLSDETRSVQPTERHTLNKGEGVVAKTRLANAFTTADSPLIHQPSDINPPDQPYGVSDAEFNALRKIDKVISWEHDPPRMPLEAFELFATRGEFQAAANVILKGKKLLLSLDEHTFNYVHNRFRHEAWQIAFKRTRQFPEDDARPLYIGIANAVEAVFTDLRAKRPIVPPVDPGERVNQTFPRIPDVVPEGNRGSAYALVWDHMNIKVFGMSLPSLGTVGPRFPCQEDLDERPHFPLYMIEHNDEGFVRLPHVWLNPQLDRRELIGYATTKLAHRIWQLVGRDVFGDPKTESESQDFFNSPAFGRTDQVLNRLYRYVEGEEGRDDGVPFILVDGEAGDYGLDQNEFDRLTLWSRDMIRYNVFTALSKSGAATGTRQNEAANNRVRRRSDPKLWYRGRLPVREFQAALMTRTVEDAAKILVDGAKKMKKMDSHVLTYAHNMFHLAVANFLEALQNVCRTVEEFDRLQVQFVQAVVLVDEVFSRVRTARGLPQILTEQEKKEMAAKNGTSVKAPEEYYVPWPTHLPNDVSDPEVKAAVLRDLFSYFAKRLFDSEIPPLEIDVAQDLDTLSLTQYANDKAELPKIILNADIRSLPVLAHALLREMITAWDLCIARRFDTKGQDAQIEALDQFLRGRKSSKSASVREICELNRWPFYTESIDTTQLQADAPGSLTYQEREKVEERLKEKQTEREYRLGTPEEEVHDMDVDSAAPVELDFYADLRVALGPWRAMELTELALRRRDGKDLWVVQDDVLYLPLREFHVACMSGLSLDAEEIIVEGMPKMIPLDPKLINFAQSAFKQVCANVFQKRQEEGAAELDDIRRAFLEQTSIVESKFMEIKEKHYQLRREFESKLENKELKPTDSFPFHIDIDEFGENVHLAGGYHPRRRRYRFPDEQEFGSRGITHDNRDEVAAYMYDLLNIRVFNGTCPPVQISFLDDADSDQLIGTMFDPSSLQFPSIWINGRVVKGYKLLGRLLAEELTLLSDLFSETDFEEDVKTVGGQNYKDTLEGVDSTPEQMRALERKFHLVRQKEYEEGRKAAAALLTPQERKRLMKLLQKQEDAKEKFIGGRRVHRKVLEDGSVTEYLEGEVDLANLSTKDYEYLRQCLIRQMKDEDDEATHRLLLSLEDLKPKTENPKSVFRQDAPMDAEQEAAAKNYQANVAAMKGEVPGSTKSGQVSVEEMQQAAMEAAATIGSMGEGPAEVRMSPYATPSAEEMSKQSATDENEDPEATRKDKEKRIFKGDPWADSDISQSWTPETVSMRKAQYVRARAQQRINLLKYPFLLYDSAATLWDCGMTTQEIEKMQNYLLFDKGAVPMNLFRDLIDGKVCSPERAAALFEKAIERPEQIDVEIEPDRPGKLPIHASFDFQQLAVGENGEQQTKREAKEMDAGERQEKQRKEIKFRSKNARRRAKEKEKEKKKKAKAEARAQAARDRENA